MKKDIKIKKLPSKEERQKIRNRLLHLFVLVSFIIPVVYLSIRLIFLKLSGVDAGEVMPRSSGEYVLMILQCLLGIVALYIPSMLTKKFKFELPTLLYVLYIVFLYGAIFLGEVQSFYYLVPYWDIILHAMSSVMTGFFGFMVVVILNKDEHVAMKLSPFFVALFAFCFSISVGTVWEIYEFLGDGFMGLNMQKFMDDAGNIFIGRDALSDTMEDIIVDCLGTLVATVVGYLSIRFGKGYKNGIIAVKTLTEEKIENVK